MAQIYEGELAATKREDRLYRIQGINLIAFASFNVILFENSPY